MKRFVAFTWPNLSFWVVILCPEFKPKNLKKISKKRIFSPALMLSDSDI